MGQEEVKADGSGAIGRYAMITEYGTDYMGPSLPSTHKKKMVEEKEGKKRKKETLGSW